MEFRLKPEHSEFRTEVLGFLNETLTEDFWAHHRSEELPGWSPVFSRAAAARGMLGIAWPQEYGGAAKGIMEQTIYMEEMAYAGAPQEHHRRAIQQVGPSIMLFGTDEQKKRYLPAISSAQVSFAMGLSEPNAGSDLASVETRAVRDGDEYVITGRKRFTSGAHYSDLLWTVARTDPNAPKHRGISMIIVPLHAPGVEVRPLLDMQNDHHFNEIFLDEVRVPADHLVGEENRGWYVNARTMDYERSGGAHIGGLRRHMDDALDAARKAPGGVSHATRMRLAECAGVVEAVRILGYRVAWLREQGVLPNHEVSIVKLLAAETHQKLSNIMINALGLAAQASGHGLHGEEFGPAYVASASNTVGQGTSEVQRNVIATRGLGLPRG